MSPAPGAGSRSTAATAVPVPTVAVYTPGGVTKSVQLIHTVSVPVSVSSSTVVRPITVPGPGSVIRPRCVPSSACRCTSPTACRVRNATSSGSASAPPGSQRHAVSTESGSSAISSVQSAGSGRTGSAAHNRQRGAECVVSSNSRPLGANEPASRYPSTASRICVGADRSVDRSNSHASWRRTAPTVAVISNHRPSGDPVTR